MRQAKVMGPWLKDSVVLDSAIPNRLTVGLTLKRHGSWLEGTVACHARDPGLNLSEPKDFSPWNYFNGSELDSEVMSRALGSVAVAGCTPLYVCRNG